MNESRRAVRDASGASVANGALTALEFAPGLSVRDQASLTIAPLFRMLRSCCLSILLSAACKPTGTGYTDAAALFIVTFMFSPAAFETQGERTT
jgi:hypothetical protein